MSPEWKHEDKWSRRGRNFLVTVTRHEVAVHEPEGPHRWCVYAWIYPKHPRFARFEGDRMWQDAATELPFHGGPSLLRWHRAEDGTATSVQVGADYNHLHDDRFTYMANPAEAYAVFNDADGLFAMLEREDVQP
jgi:hypothetical protein